MTDDLLQTTIHGMDPDECAEAILVMNTYLTDLLKGFEEENFDPLTQESRIDLIRSTLDTVKEILEVNHSIRDYLYFLEERVKQEQPLGICFTIAVRQ
jgi:hypothetical protein